MLNGSTLLALPLEIREQILLEAIAVQEAPTDPPPSRDCQWVYVWWQEFGRDAQHLLHHDLWADNSKRYRNPAIPVLLLNHQIHDEVLVLLRRPGTPCEYHLHVKLFGQWGLWPTWTYVPFLKRHSDADALHVQVKLFEPPRQLAGEFASRLTDDRPAVRRGMGAGTSCARLVDILTSFFVYGPLSKNLLEDTRDWGHCRFTVKDLIVDVLPPETETPSLREFLGPDSHGEYFDHWPSTLSSEDAKFFSWPEKWPQGQRLSEADVPSDLTELVAMLFARNLCGLLSVRSGGWKQEKLIYEGVMNTIDIRLNGVSKMKFDVGKCLMGRKRINWDGWRDSVDAARKQRKPRSNGERPLDSNKV